MAEPECSAVPHNNFLLNTYTKSVSQNLATCGLQSSSEDWDKYIIKRGTTKGIAKETAVSGTSAFGQRKGVGGSLQADEKHW